VQAMTHVRAMPLSFYRKAQHQVQVVSAYFFELGLATLVLALLVLAAMCGRVLILKQVVALTDFVAQTYMLPTLCEVQHRSARMLPGRGGLKLKHIPLVLGFAASAGRVQAFAEQLLFSLLP
jgi:hypothetical protein